jgi:hypothetical protein
MSGEKVKMVRNGVTVFVNPQEVGEKAKLGFSLVQESAPVASEQASDLAPANVAEETKAPAKSKK